MRYSKEITINSVEKLNEFAALLAQNFWLANPNYLQKILKQRAFIIHLIGNLGSGKTTWTRGFLRGLGFTGKVKSPTFSLIEPYIINNQKIHHFDLYRLKDPRELEFLGANDYFNEPNSLCIIEWPEYGGEFLPVSDLTLKFAYIETKDDARDISLETDIDEQLLKIVT